MARLRAGAPICACTSPCLTLVLSHLCGTFVLYDACRQLLMLAEVVEDLHNCVRTVAKKNPNPILSVAHTQEPRPSPRLPAEFMCRSGFLRSCSRNGGVRGCGENLFFETPGALFAAPWRALAFDSLLQGLPTLAGARSSWLLSSLVVAGCRYECGCAQGAWLEPSRRGALRPQVTANTASRWPALRL